jgi:hypothetical protein
MRTIDWICLIAALAIGRAWIRIDQDLLPPRLLMPSFYVLVLILMTAFFAFVKPRQPFALARTVAVTLTAAAGALIAVQHVVSTFDISYKMVFILGATALMPFVVAAGYRWVNQ